MRYPRWEGPLIHALAETDFKRLADEVSLAEDALFDRLRDIGPVDVAAEERLAIQIGIRDLLRLKIEKLGWTPLELSGSGR
jgi:hypothetical protein